MKIKINANNLFVVALVISTFAGSNGTEYFSAIPSLVLMCFALFRIINPNYINDRFVPKDHMGRNLGIFLSLCGLISAYFNLDVYSFLFAINFFLTWISIYYIRDFYSAQKAIRAGAQAGIICSIIFVLFTYQEIFSAIRMDITLSNSYYRYSPWGIHPNLIGHIFGLYLIVMFWHVLIEHGLILRFIYFCGSIIALVLIIASSSRGGLFAAIFGIVVALIPYIYKLNKNKRFIFLFLILFLFMNIFGYYFTSSILYLQDLLQFDSDYRGLDTGFTGRVEGWLYILNNSLEDTYAFLFGRGFRNKWIDGLPFSIDNGFLVVFAELGILALILVLHRILKLYSIYGVLFRRVINAEIYLAFSIVLFFIAESVVARYFLSVGNPASIIFLFLLMDPRFIRYGNNISKLE